MKINRGNTRKKKIITISIIVIALALAGLAYAIITSQKNSAISPSTTTDSSSDTASDEVNSDQDESIPPNPNTPDKTPTQYDKANSDDSKSSSSPELNAVINYKKVTNGALSLRVTIDKRLDTGSCELVATRQSDAKRVSKVADIVPNPSSSSCEGFDVPASELGTGTWSLKVTITSGELKSTLTESVAI